MINIALMLEPHLHTNDMPLFFAENNIRIIYESGDLSDNTLEPIASLNINVDIMLISECLIGHTDGHMRLNEVKGIFPDIRFILILPGYRNQYIPKQLSKYRQVSDIVFEGNKLDLEYLVRVINKIPVKRP